MGPGVCEKNKFYATHQNTIAHCHLGERITLPHNDILVFIFVITVFFLKSFSEYCFSFLKTHYNKYSSG